MKVPLYASKLGAILLSSLACWVVVAGTTAAIFGPRHLEGAARHEFAQIHEHIHDLGDRKITTKHQDSA
ncbi:hypothetical protein GCM10017612_06610 [Novosphingobium resinovorum]|nr:hypothetical protein GCM10017612_06610 [Novosphingobium resinovorum]